MFSRQRLLPIGQDANFECRAHPRTFLLQQSLRHERKRSQVCQRCAIAIALAGTLTPKDHDGQFSRQDATHRPWCKLRASSTSSNMFVATIIAAREEMIASLPSVRRRHHIGWNQRINMLASVQPTARLLPIGQGANFARRAHPRTCSLQQSLRHERKRSQVCQRCAVAIVLAGTLTPKDQHGSAGSTPIAHKPGGKLQASSTSSDMFVAAIVAEREETIAS